MFEDDQDRFALNNALSRPMSFTIALISALSKVFVQEFTAEAQRSQRDRKAGTTGSVRKTTLQVAAGFQPQPITGASRFASSLAYTSQLSIKCPSKHPPIPPPALEREQWPLPAPPADICISAKAAGSESASSPARCRGTVKSSCGVSPQIPCSGVYMTVALHLLPPEAPLPL